MRRGFRCWLPERFSGLKRPSLRLIRFQWQNRFLECLFRLRIDEIPVIDGVLLIARKGGCVIANTTATSGRCIQNRGGLTAKSNPTRGTMQEDQGDGTRQVKDKKHDQHFLPSHGSFSRFPEACIFPGSYHCLASRKMRQSAIGYTIKNDCGVIQNMKQRSAVPIATRGRRTCSPSRGREEIS